MTRRQLKCLKIFFIILGYLTAFIIIHQLMPVTVYHFVKEELRVGEKYVFVFLVAEAPAFSDVDGADVFTTRRCQYCFITNNKGFMPLSEYDAIVVRGGRDQLETATFDHPERRYVMDTTDQCLQRKLRGCDTEPIVTSYSTKISYGLCDLCRLLHAQRDPPFGFSIKRKLSEDEACVN